MASSPLARRLSGGAAMAFGIRVAGMAILLGTHLVIANAMSDAHYGMYAYALALAPTLAILGELGMPQAALRFIPEYAQQATMARCREFLHFARRTTLTCSLSLVGVGWATYIMWRSWLQADVAQSAWYGLAFVPAIALVHLYQEALRSYKRIFYSQFFEQLLIPVVLLATALTAASAGRQLSLTFLLALHLGLYCGIALLLAMITRRVAEACRGGPAGIEPATATDLAAGNLSEDTRRQWLSVAAPLSVSAVTAVLLTRCDLLLIGVMMSSTDVAYYSAAAKLGMILTLGLAALNAIATPFFVEAHQLGNRLRLQKLVSCVTWSALGVTLLPGIAIMFGGQWLLALFGASYTVAYPALLCLTIAQLVNVSCGPVGPLMMTTGGHREYAYTMGAACLINVVATPIAIYFAGMLGAAIVNLIGTVIWNVALVVQVRRRLGVATYPTLAWTG